MFLWLNPIAPAVLTDVRPIECERIKSTLTSKWNGTLWVAEDTAMLDTSMDIVTSRDVRQKLKENQPVRHLVGGLIDEYFKKHLIGPKVCTHSMALSTLSL